MRNLFFSLAMISTTLIGCSLDPDYHRPALPVTGTYPTGPASEAVSGKPAQAAAADLGWRNFFNDSVSAQLIAFSLANNRDLRVAALNIEVASAQYGVDRASLFPAINGTAGLERSTTPGDVSSLSGTSNIRDYSLSLGTVSWELDFFGKIRSKARAGRVPPRGVGAVGK
jgi:multidrug efflux system outer membrane protein